MRSVCLRVYCIWEKVGEQEKNMNFIVYHNDMIDSHMIVWIWEKNSERMGYIQHIDKNIQT